MHVCASLPLPYTCRHADRHAATQARGYADIAVLIYKERKGKEEYLYSAFIQRLVSKCSDMDHTVLPANACLSFVRVHQMATPLNVVANI